MIGLVSLRDILKIKIKLKPNHSVKFYPGELIGINWSINPFIEIASFY